jgi:Zn finger protein HypA/HybF involved in hydrogenase expression
MFEVNCGRCDQTWVSEEWVSEYTWCPECDAQYAKYEALMTGEVA